MEEKNNIILIGMPGAGKPTIGMVLSKILNFKYVDADVDVLNQVDKTMRKVIEACGPEALAQVQNEFMLDVLTENSVIATGDNAICSERVMEHFKNIGHIVYIEISYNELLWRLGVPQDSEDDHLKDDIHESLRRRHEKRLPLFEEYADVTVNVDDLSVTAAARKIAETMEQIMVEK